MAELKYAKMPSSIVHPSNLFISLPKGVRAKEKLNVSYSAGDSTYRFLGPEPLDSTDLRVLQGLVAQATADAYLPRRPPGDRVGESTPDHQVKTLLERCFAEESENTVAVRFRISGFVESLGYVDGGSIRKIVLASITRLSSVTVVVEQPDILRTTRLVTGYVKDPVTGKMIVGLNPLLSSALTSPNNFLAVSIEEARQLKSDIAHLLHWRLHFINQADAKKVSLNRLCEYVYPSSEATIPETTLRRRRSTVRKALYQLERIGWGVMKRENDVYTIIRPAHLREDQRRMLGITRTNRLA